MHIEDARSETLRAWESGEDEADEGDNLADRAMVRYLRDLVEEGDQTLPEFLQDIGGEERADWARRPDGTWKTWEELDWEKHGSALWKLIVEWSERHQEAELQLAGAGLVDPKVRELEKQLREMEAEGKADTWEYARLKLTRDYLRAPHEVMREKQEGEEK